MPDGRSFSSSIPAISYGPRFTSIPPTASFDRVHKPRRHPVAPFFIFFGFQIPRLEDSVSGEHDIALGDLDRDGHVARRMAWRWKHRDAGQYFGLTMHQLEVAATKRRPADAAMVLSDAAVTGATMRRPGLLGLLRLARHRGTASAAR